MEALDDAASVLRAAAALIGTTIAVLLRRRWTVTTSIVVLVVGLFSMFHGASADFVAIPIMLFSLAVYRSIRLAVMFFALFIAEALVVSFPPWALPGAVDDEFDVLLLAFCAAIGLLIGIATHSRRAHIASLLEQAAQSEELAATYERTRIAREMHDIVSHTLTVVILLADGAVASPDEALARSAMKNAAEAARGALSELRILLGALRDVGNGSPSSQLTAQELPDLVDAFVQAGLPARLRIIGVPNGNSAVRLAIHRIVQEGFTNALRYSREATRVEATVSYSDDGVEVVVENDGAVENAPSVGARQGLRGLRERTDLLGGRIQSAFVGDGVWRLRAWMPYEAGSGGVEG
ncbi:MULTISPECIES: sensor histidine kinase [Bacteria]|uniref:sensor histidine kinase n=1 Tax=Bacteria TaxID=2 RepID=UPI003C7D91C4